MPITSFPNGVSSYGVPVLPSNVGAPNGNVFIVDSGDPAGGDVSGYGTAEHPFATIDYAVGKCTASNGDVIHVLPGHAETVSAAAGLDLDVAGITIVFHGEGNARGSITFGTAVGADMDVDAADITLINPRFVAGIDALTGPIDVNAARFKMIGATWQDATSINTTDCVVADANADDLYIEDFEFVDGDAAGTQKQSFIQIAAATRPTLKNIKCTGDFATGIIENGTAWVDAYLDDLVLDNANASPTVCILLQATSSGWCRNSSLRVASGSTGFTAANDMQFDNVGVIGTDADTTGTGALVSTIGALDDSAATGAVTTSDTIMAYLKQLVTQNGTELDTDTLGSILVGTSGIATFPSAAVAANGVSIAEVLRYIHENQLKRYVSHVKADVTAGTAWTTANSPVTIFTVTGDVLCRAYAVVTTNMTSASSTGTLELGVTGVTAGLLVMDTVDGTAFQSGDVWTLIAAADNGGGQIADEWFFIGNGADILLTVATNNMTAGGVTIYLEYIPISSGASVVSAGGES